MKIKELVHRISKIMKKKIVIKTTPLRKGGTKIRMPDITKIKKFGNQGYLISVESLKSLLTIFMYNEGTSTLSSPIKHLSSGTPQLLLRKN